MIHPGMKAEMLNMVSFFAPYGEAKEKGGKKKIAAFADSGSSTLEFVNSLLYSMGDRWKRWM